MKILITGGSGDIGSSIINKIKLKWKDATICEVNRGETNTTTYKCDLTNIKEVEELCNKIKSTTFDVLINCAGWSTPIPFEKLNIDDINKRMNINYYAPLMLMKSVIPNMKNNNGGVIINISSVTAVTPVPDLHIYSAAKRALDSITISTAVEYSNNNIRINGIHPGSIDTNAAREGRLILGDLRNIKKEQYEENMKKINGYNRLLTPDEVANTVVFLMSDESSGITGQIVNVCGIMEVH